MPFRPARLVAAALALVLLAGCTRTIGDLPSRQAPDVAANPVSGYILEPGNRVRLTVYNELKLSGDYTLDAAGKLSLPLIGNILASGLTADELADRIREELKGQGFMQDPSVAVEVQTFRPFYVLGEVRNPGEFPYVPGQTVLSAIAKARGYDYRAYEGEVILIREENGEQTEYLATERTPILPGDIVRVLERRF